MAQTQKVQGVATVIGEEDGYTYVQYHSTKVVKFKLFSDHAEVILDTGGWNTNTTRLRMNQTANQFGLGFKVFQKDFTPYVQVGDHKIMIKDGMKFNCPSF